jgi:hypothetical protein
MYTLKGIKASLPQGAFKTRQLLITESLVYAGSEQALRAS